MTSLWLDRPRERRSDDLPADGRVQDLVVGAGLTGLVTGLLLARAGRRVAVVEARHAGSVTTGRTTAKVSVLQATKLSSILRLQPGDVVRGYVEANRDGLDWLRSFCTERGVAVQDRDAATFAAEPRERDKARQEYDAARSVGLDVTWGDTLDVPFPVHGAVVLADQAQLDPVALVDALVDELREQGGTLHEGHRVVRVSRRGAPRVDLDTGETLEAQDVVLATGTPVLDRGLHFAKLEPKRSYLLAFRHPSPPELMCISAGGPVRSVRDVPGDDPMLLVGGSGHPVGREPSPRRHYDELRAWAAEHFPGAEETHAWSAQDYGAYSGVPIVGPILPGMDHIQVATGYDKWGLAAAVAAATSIAAGITGAPEPQRHWTAPWRPTPPSLVQACRINGEVALSLAEGVGRLGKAPLCTHLGGMLRWNDGERSWDCPLHGSRFDEDGSVLEGPATRPLAGGTPPQ